MLLDTKSPYWTKQKTADPYSVENLIAWLEKQPADKEYEWYHPRYCLLGQFVRSTGVRREREIGRISRELGVFGRPVGDVALYGPYTFGAALERARALAGQ